MSPDGSTIVEARLRREQADSGEQGPNVDLSAVPPRVGRSGASYRALDQQEDLVACVGPRVSRLRHHRGSGWSRGRRHSWRPRPGRWPPRPPARWSATHPQPTYNLRSSELGMSVAIPHLTAGSVPVTFCEPRPINWRRSSRQEPSPGARCQTERPGPGMSFATPLSTESRRCHRADPHAVHPVRSRSH